jgi:hypothetical protein
MAKRQAPLGSKEMADLLKPLAQMIILYIPLMTDVPVKRKGEAEALQQSLLCSMGCLNNLVDMDDRTWEVEKVVIHE